jgi:hypothetical protein
MLVNFSRQFSSTIDDLDNIVLQSLDNSNGMNSSHPISLCSIQTLNDPLANIDISSILEQLDSPIPMLFSPTIN